MTSSVNSALSQIDAAPDKRAVAAFIPPLARNEIEFEQQEKRESVKGNQDGVGICANAVYVMQNVRAYAQLRYDFLDGTTSPTGMDVRLNNCRQGALAPAQRIEEALNTTPEQKRAQADQILPNAIQGERIR